MSKRPLIRMTVLQVKGLSDLVFNSDRLLIRLPKSQNRSPTGIKKTSTHWNQIWAPVFCFQVKLKAENRSPDLIPVGWCFLTPVGLLFWLSESQIRRRYELGPDFGTPLTYSTVILINAHLDPARSDFWKKWQNSPFFSLVKKNDLVVFHGAHQGIFCLKMCSIFVVLLGLFF